MPCAAHNVPSEVLELFIDELGNTINERQSWDALRSCMLVCHAFRYRAQRHLFRDIKLVQDAHIQSTKLVSRLWKLRAMMLDCHDVSISLVPHVRSFRLVMESSAYDAYGILDNEVLPVILTKLLPQLEEFAVWIRSFSMAVNWSHLNTEFRDVFMALCRSPNLKTLRLRNMVDLPPTILAGSAVKNICFHILRFDSSTSPILEGLIPNGQVESINIDYCFPFPPLTDIDIDHPDLQLEDPQDPSLSAYLTALAQVKRLKYIIFSQTDFTRSMRVARNAFAHLEVLELEIIELVTHAFFDDAWSIPFDKLPNLHTLVLGHKTDIRLGAYAPLTKVAAILQPSVDTMPCPALRNIEFNFVVASHAPWIKKVAYFPGEHVWNALDGLLCEESFDGVTSVTLNLEYHIIQERPWAFDSRLFVERCERHCREVFPKIHSSKRKQMWISASCIPLP
ncbi:hypothetical protein CVT24_001675 [Panaeolus cyanescens]|uniref:F-box domain-containing protein n=1 Tax=Panaeolus cyanescens TaxID=181874 RepID=A0A409VSX0_9AGAR|nr:hypothetical protein CVT24_001675 [Panaeolus cyanescens]